MANSHGKHGKFLHFSRQLSNGSTFILNSERNKLIKKESNLSEVPDRQQLLILFIHVKNIKTKAPSKLRIEVVD